jgi:hemerythrin-like domain-containing protein
LETKDEVSKLRKGKKVKRENLRIKSKVAKEESTDSIKIIQEHNWVVDFLKHKIPNMENHISQQNEQDQQYQQAVQKEINEFVVNLRNHFSEEEQIVFPLALKANLR